MRCLRLIVPLLILAALLALPAANQTVHSVVQQQADQANRAATTNATWTPGSVDLEGVSTTDDTTFSFSSKEEPTGAGLASVTESCTQPPISEAPAFGFDGETNGLIPQGKPPEECAEPVPGDFENDKAIFDEIETIEEGLGPVYNDRACGACHQNPVTGAIRQIMELRAGHTTNNTFFDAPGGSLINQRGIPTPNDADGHKSAKVQERVPPLYTAGIIGGGGAMTAEEPTRTLRTSLNTLGDGFVEAVTDGTLISLAAQQKGQTNNEVHGLVINVPVLEAGGTLRVGRFGWKNQHASLLSFSGDAYLNEMGITNLLVPDENTSLGRFVGFGSGFDVVPDNTPCEDDPTLICAEDPDQDIEVFAEFMRATQAPPRDPDIIAKFAADAGRQDPGFR